VLILSTRRAQITNRSIIQIADSVKRYSFLLGQTELFKHFVDIKVRLFHPLCPCSPCSYGSHQRARDPEYAALMDAQPQPKKRGRKKAA
jgi:SWI/SNF-related matrix-associated actin-dependent regulator of chromatin subfamily A member 5